MARVDLPPSKLRQKRRKHRVVLGLLFVFLFFVICGCLVWASWVPFLRVTSVQVEGAQTVSSSTIEQFAEQELSGGYWFVFARNNIFLYPRQDIATGLLQHYPTLRMAEVHAQDFHTVLVKVAERQPVALWCPSGQVPTGESCYYMDEQGLVYAPAPAFSAPVYATYQGPVTNGTQPGLRQYLHAEEFQSLAALVAAFAQKMPDNPIGSVMVDQNNDVRASFKDGFLLIFNLKDDGGDVFDRFGLALASDAFKGKTTADFEYLDLRFGDKLYYKVK